MKINKSAARAIDILYLLASSSKPMTQLEISQALEIPKSSTYELIYTMLDKEILEFDNQDLKTFRLGVKAVEIGINALEMNDFHQISRPLLEELSAQTGETVFLAVEDNGQIIYLDKVEIKTSIITGATVGKRRPLVSTGIGKALLAAYAMPQVKEVWERSEHIAYTPQTIVEYDALIEDLKQTRKRGYAIDNREMEDEIFCVAAPIFGREERPIASISIAVLYLRMNEERTEKFGRMIHDVALKISKRLGSRRNELF